MVNDAQESKNNLGTDLLKSAIEFKEKDDKLQAEKRAQLQARKDFISKFEDDVNVANAEIDFFSVDTLTISWKRWKREPAYPTNHDLFRSDIIKIINYEPIAGWVFERFNIKNENGVKFRAIYKPKN